MARDQKTFRSEFKQICATYRLEKIGLPEHAVPYMIDLWAQCISTSDLKDPTDDTISTLKDIQIYIRMIVEAMTLNSSYGLKPHQGNFQILQRWAIEFFRFLRQRNVFSLWERKNLNSLGLYMY